MTMTKVFTVTMIMGNGTKFKWKLKGGDYQTISLVFTNELTMHRFELNDFHPSAQYDV